MLREILNKIDLRDIVPKHETPFNELWTLLLIFNLSEYKVIQNKIRELGQDIFVRGIMSLISNTS